MKKKIKELDFFRGISAIFVMLYHYTTRYDLSFGHLKQPYYLNVKYGYMAVAVFFMLSGFLIYLKIDREKPKEFAIKRFIRLYPTYIIAMILTTSVMLISGNEFQSKISNFKEWIINLTMVPGLLGQKSVDGVYWTLQIEIIFYIIIWLVLLIKKQDKIKLLSIIWVIISLITNILLYFIDNSILKIVRICGITQYCQLFITGIIMCSIYKKENSKINYCILLLCLVNQFVALGIEYAIFLSIFDIVFYLIVMQKIKIPKIINSKLIVFLSSISYPLYLTHQFIGFSIINKLEKFGFINEIYMLIPILIAIIIAYIIHKFIEKPSLKFLSTKLLKE